MNDKNMLEYYLGKPSFWDKYGTLIVVLSVILLLIIVTLIICRKHIRTHFFIKSLRTVELINHKTVGVPRNSSFAPPLLTRQDYVFRGWFIDSALTIPWTSTQKVTCDMALYPKWEKE